MEKYEKPVLEVITLEDDIVTSSVISVNLAEIPLWWSNRTKNS